MLSSSERSDAGERGDEDFSTRKKYTRRKRPTSVKKNQPPPMKQGGKRIRLKMMVAPDVFQSNSSTLVNSPAITNIQLPEIVKATKILDSTSIKQVGQPSIRKKRSRSIQSKPISKEDSTKQFCLSCEPDEKYCFNCVFKMPIDISDYTTKSTAIGVDSKLLTKRLNESLDDGCVSPIRLFGTDSLEHKEPREIETVVELDGISSAVINTRSNSPFKDLKYDLNLKPNLSPNSNSDIRKSLPNKFLEIENPSIDQTPSLEQPSLETPNKNEATRLNTLVEQPQKSLSPIKANPTSPITNESLDITVKSATEIIENSVMLDISSLPSTLPIGEKRKSSFNLKIGSAKRKKICLDDGLDINAFDSHKAIVEDPNLVAEEEVGNVSSQMETSDLVECQPIVEELSNDNSVNENFFGGVIVENSDLMDLSDAEGEIAVEFEKVVLYRENVELLREHTSQNIDNNQSFQYTSLIDAKKVENSPLSPTLNTELETSKLEGSNSSNDEEEEEEEEEDETNDQNNNQEDPIKNKVGNKPTLELNRGRFKTRSKVFSPQNTISPGQTQTINPPTSTTQPPEFAPKIYKYNEDKMSATIPDLVGSTSKPFSSTLSTGDDPQKAVWHAAEKRQFEKSLKRYGKGFRVISETLRDVTVGLVWEDPEGFVGGGKGVGEVVCFNYGEKRKGVKKRLVGQRKRRYEFRKPKS